MTTAPIPEEAGTAGTREAQSASRPDAACGTNPEVAAADRRMGDVLRHALLLTPSAAPLPGLSLAVTYAPDFADQRPVGGDFFDAFALPGLVHRTAAGPGSGVRTMEVWLQTIEAGAATPVHKHDCEEAVVILSGSGRLSVEGEPDADFGLDSTLIVPRGAVHQIVNTGFEPMTLVAALRSSPVVVTTPQGQVIPLPWQQT